MTQVETKTKRSIFTVSFLHNMGIAIARNLSMIINTKPWLGTYISLSKVHILQWKMFLFSSAGKSFELMICLKIRQGIRNTATRRADAAMLAIYIRSRIGSLILMKAVMRNMFPTKDTWLNRVKTSRHVLLWEPVLVPLLYMEQCSFE